MHSGKWRGLFLILALVAAFSPVDGAADPFRACGRKIAPCPEDMFCKPDSPQCTDLNRCGGTCAFKNEYPLCGGLMSPHKRCDQKSDCIGNVRWKGEIPQDLPGICVPKSAPRCGGIAGRRCPKGLYCYGDPSDGCDPKKGARDCSGICL